MTLYNKQKPTNSDGTASCNFCIHRGRIIESYDDCVASGETWSCALGKTRRVARNPSGTDIAYCGEWVLDEGYWEEENNKPHTELLRDKEGDIVFASFGVCPKCGGLANSLSGKCDCLDKNDPMYEEPEWLKCACTRFGKCSQPKHLCDGLKYAGLNIINCEEQGWGWTLGYYFGYNKEEYLTHCPKCGIELDELLKQPLKETGEEHTCKELREHGETVIYDKSCDGWVWYYYKGCIIEKGLTHCPRCRVDLLVDKRKVSLK